MSVSLLPQIIANALPDITPHYLQNRGIRLLMLDFDNTIVPYTTNVPTREIDNWLQEMKQSNISVCVVSNSKRDRVKIFCHKYGISCITYARKPFPCGIRACMAQFCVEPTECALVGDQIYTDILGANCCGVTSILVTAIDNHNFWLKARHVLELPFIYFARKRRMTNEKSG